MEEIAVAVRQLSDRGLPKSCSWLTGLMCCCGGVGEEGKSTSTTTPGGVANYGFSARYTRAKSLFDVGEFARASWVLSDPTNADELFLHVYSDFLAIEKRYSEDSSDKGPGGPGLDSMRPSSHRNASLLVIREKITTGAGRGLKPNAFCDWILGIVTRELQFIPEAKESLVRSVNNFPWNISAWIDLAELCADESEVSQLVATNIAPHVMRNVFYAYSLFILQQHASALEAFSSLLQQFPGNSFFRAKIASAYFQLREYDKAMSAFQQLYHDDPFCLDHVDDYSHIFYLNHDMAHLALLARSTSETDKQRSETCIVVGNYFSLSGRQIVASNSQLAEDYSRRAVTYFQRAAMFDPRKSDAYTLMGLEYLLLRDVQTAVSSFWKAVEINKRDFKAWNGLGTTYQVLKQPLYAMWYFRKAVSLRPNDERMWAALGDIYSTLGNTDSAIECFTRANTLEAPTGVSSTLHRLAGLHNKKGDAAQAFEYYRADLARRDAEKVGGPEVAEDLMFLGTWAKAHGNLDDAESYFTRLLGYSDKDTETAKIELCQIHINRQQQAIPTPNNAP
ncbi:anaphase-promoting complex subunit 8 [Pelomyxa schiedti]|nr:anaphase-promoting complex subunit 8 [Pelomyxa schiedti]